MEPWEGSINEVTQSEGSFVGWSFGLSFKRLINLFHLSLLAWAWKLSFRFCCFSFWADQFLTGEKRYVNYSVFDLFIGRHIFQLLPKLGLEEKMAWQISRKTINKWRQDQKNPLLVFISVCHLLQCFYHPFSLLQHSLAPSSGPHTLLEAIQWEDLWATGSSKRWHDSAASLYSPVWAGTHPLTLVSKCFVSYAILSN